MMWQAVKQWRRNRREVLPPAPAPARPAARLFPLTAAQQRLWFLARLYPGSPAYHAAQGLRLRGPLNSAALIDAWQVAAAAHPWLRAVFTLTPDGTPLSQVLPDLRLSLTPQPLTGDLEATLRAAARQPFQLHAAPLLRAALWQIAPDEHVLLLTSHRLAADEAGLRQVLLTLADAYKGNVAVEPAALINFHAVEEAWLAGPTGQAAQAYWRARLADGWPVLELPADLPRPPRRRWLGASHTMLTPSALTDALLAYAEAQQVSPAVVVLTALHILVQRYSQQTDVVIGWFTPAAPPLTAPGSGQNLLPLRWTIEPDRPAADGLRQTAQALAQALAHPLPFATLVKLAAPQREQSHAPLCQVACAWEELPSAPVMADLQAAWQAVHCGDTTFDLNVTWQVTPERLRLHLGYATELFSAETPARFAAQLLTVLDSLLADPTCPAGRLPVLPTDQRRQLVEAWNATRQPFPAQRGPHQYFEAQAQCTPDQPALRCGPAQLTYHQLNARANQLAHFLRAQGVQPGDWVGVCLPRQVDLIVALLACLKAGAAYVPLDPAYPAARLNFMIADSGVRLALTVSDLRPRLAAGAAALVCLDAVGAALATLPTDNLLTPLPPEALSHIIYTSGSTGQPKGVAITQRGVSALITWAQEIYSPADLAGVLAATSVCFDLSVFEIFVPLSCGGMVILAENILALVGERDGAAVTLINTVPSAMTELLRVGALPATTRVVNLAGEPFAYSLAHQLYAVGVKSVFNLYGPSEDTTYSTAARLSPDAGLLERPPIGRPIANTQAYVLDERGELAPPGVIGELYLGGAGVARGYVHRPQLTAERFVPDPFSAAPGARLYRTGDLVRYRPNGDLEFIGRRDHQIKLRGYRIELGEIEAVLEQHPLVEAAAVVVQASPAGAPRLAAWVATGQADSGLTAADLRRFLAERLPAYLLPALYTILPSLPRTPNGKIDRHALTMAAGADAAGVGAGLSSNPAHDPRNAVEEKLIRIWQEILGVDHISPNDDFFALGGDSLLAVRLMARIEREFGRKLPLSALF